MRMIPPALRERLQSLAFPLSVAALCLALVVGGLFLIVHRSAKVSPLRLRPDEIAPALALRTLAGEADTAVIDQALEEGKLETALATLYYSTSLSDRERVNYYIVLGQKFAADGRKERAFFAYDQATSILLLSPAPFDEYKASAHLQIGKSQAALGDRAKAERNFDYAYTIARYSAYVPEAQRRFILSNLASEYKTLGLDRKSDESTRALASLPPTIPAPQSPASVELPPANLGDDVRAATAWRMRAALRVINSMGGKNGGGLAEAQRNLEDALRAEDDLRSAALENRLGQSPTLEERAALAKARSDWLILRKRIAERGFGLNLMPSWQRQLADINKDLRQAIANYFLLRREMAVNLADPIDAAQGRVDLLRLELLQGRQGLYPDYPENRLITELAQATKERIDLREDGLHVAILSQNGGGQFALTTADLWGRPAAMASAGLGMSFPTIRPSAYPYVQPTLVPTLTPSPVAQRTATTVITGRETPVIATATGTPTQPTSPLAMATPTARPSAPTPILPTSFSPTPPPVAPPPAAPPTATPVPQPTATPTPAYNYQVIYASGPIVRQETGNDNFHIVGMVVDQNGRLISGIQQRISWCCPPGQAVHPRPTIDVDNGRFDFFVSRGQYTLDIIDGSATTQPIVVNTDVKGLTGYVEWEFTIQRTGLGMPPYQSPTPTKTGTPTATGTPVPPTATPPLPGASPTPIALDPGWNFVALPMAPVTSLTAATWQSEINNQINIQGGGVSTIGAWDGSRISPYSGNISLGTGYFLYITGTNRVTWWMTGYPLGGPITLNLNAGQKTSIAIPYSANAPATAAEVKSSIDSTFGAGTFVRLWRMANTRGDWQYYDGTPSGMPSFDIKPTEGYLIEVSRSIAWTPGRGTPPTSTPTVTPTPTITPTPPPDLYEPNNDFAHAAEISLGVPVITKIGYPNDLDYYKFNVPGPTTLYLSLTNLPDDYDLYLYDPSQNRIDGSFLGGTTPEYITRTVTIGGVYYALVQGADASSYDTTKPYKLLITTTPQ